MKRELTVRACGRETRPGVALLARAPWSVLAMALTACGGGGGGAGDPDPADNRAPVLVTPAPDQRLIAGHAFTYDISQGGTAVTDPDGDHLTYQVRVNFGASGFVLPNGLSNSGSVISGVPTETGTWEIQVQVDDPSSINSIFFTFRLRVVPNSAPVIVNANRPQLVGAGEYVDYDVAQAGATFSDPDGDPITYAVSLRGDPHGLAISGTHVAGTFDAIGAVEATITASDAYGGAASDALLIASPAAESAAIPELPATPYIYRAEDLPLPYSIRLGTHDTEPDGNRTTDAGATLGRVLFYDRRLSITNTVACASCHEQSRGFASSRRFDTGVLGIPLGRNAMALANVRYSSQRAWFSDMRVQGDLRDLIFEPIENHDELGMSLYSVDAKLGSTTFYPALFAAAFGSPDITRERIAAALAQFLQALISYQSKSDLANNPMTNDPPDPEAVFDAVEMRGLEIYNARCAHCHELRTNINVWQANNGLDAIPTDPGTLNLALRRDGSVGVFRAASLRNIAVSGPYMHDGRFSALRDVINHYDHGIQEGPHLDPTLRDVFGAPIRLNLSEEDKDALEAFLNSLTDHAFLGDPKFSNPFPT